MESEVKQKPAERTVKKTDEPVSTYIGYQFLAYQIRLSKILAWDRNSFLAYRTGISVKQTWARKCCLTRGV